MQSIKSAQRHTKKESLHKKKDSPIIVNLLPIARGYGKTLLPALTVIHDRQFSWLRFIMPVRLPKAPRSSDITHAQHSPYSGGTAPALHRYSLLNLAQSLPCQGT